MLQLWLFLIQNYCHMGLLLTFVTMNILRYVSFVGKYWMQEAVVIVQDIQKLAALRVVWYFCSKIAPFYSYMVHVLHISIHHILIPMEKNTDISKVVLWTWMKKGIIMQSFVTYNIISYVYNNFLKTSFFVLISSCRNEIIRKFWVGHSIPREVVRNRSVSYRFIRVGHY